MLVCVTLCQWGHRLQFSDHSQSNFACSSWPIGDQLVAKLMTTFLQVVLCTNKWMDGGCRLRPRIFLKRVCWRRHLCPINIHLFTEHCSASYRDSTGTEQTNANSFCVNEAPWLIAKLESWHWGLVIYNQIVTWTSFAILAMFFWWPVFHFEFSISFHIFCTKSFWQTNKFFRVISSNCAALFIDSFTNH